MAIEAGKNSTAPAIRRVFTALRCSKTPSGRRQAAPLAQCSEFLTSLIIRAMFHVEHLGHNVMLILITLESIHRLSTGSNP
jgi:hypothetical protein